jgi:hypothetical protein
MQDIFANLYIILFIIYLEKLAKLKYLNFRMVSYINLTQNDHDTVSKDTVVLFFRDPSNNTRQIEINVNLTVKDLKHKVKDYSKIS